MPSAWSRLRCSGFPKAPRYRVYLRRRSAPLPSAGALRQLLALFILVPDRRGARGLLRLCRAGVGHGPLKAQVSAQDSRLLDDDVTLCVDQDRLIFRVDGRAVYRGGAALPVVGPGILYSPRSSSHKAVSLTSTT